MSRRKRDINTALFVSGSGSTAKAILNFWKAGGFERIRPVALISSRDDAGAIAMVKEFNQLHGTDIEIYVMNRSMYHGSQELFGEALLKLMDKLSVDYIAQRGWLPLTPNQVVEAFTRKGRMIDNQHPGPLDPGRGYGGVLYSELKVSGGIDAVSLYGQAVDFGGAGMYGERVVAARLYYALLTGDKNQFWTEATLHYATENFDEGRLISTLRLGLDTYFRSITLEEVTAHPEQLKEVVAAVQKILLPLEHENALKGMKLLERGEAGQGLYRDEPLVPVAPVDGVDYRALAKSAKMFAINLYKE